LRVQRGLPPRGLPPFTSPSAGAAPNGSGFGSSHASVTGLSILLQHLLL